MTSRLELKSRWKQLVNRTLKSEDEECISILYENDWVRILGVRNTDHSEEKRIEVEVSLPLGSISAPPDDITGLEVRSFVQNLIKHLEYLLSLADSGFTLGIMTREGIYTAYLEFENSPSDTMFDVLLPPTL